MEVNPATVIGNDDKDKNIEELKDTKIVVKWEKPDSDDENDENRYFDVNEAWDMLLNLPSCVTIMMKKADQHKLKLIVGKNVSQEFPWKQIRLKYFYNTDIFDYVDNADTILDGFRMLQPDNHLLIGYAPILTQDMDDIPEEDPFITFLVPDDAKIALMIIRNIEMFENWKMQHRLIKKPRPWQSLGSEEEIVHMQRFNIMDPVDIEIQSVYPLQIPLKKEFSTRTASNVRDGYVELLPNDNMKFENITRKRITIGIQSAPDLKTVDQQTDPTFPTNAWTQYVYEINEGDDELDVTSEEEEGDKHESRRNSRNESIKSEIRTEIRSALSDQIKFLLRTLEFNQVDMYRNDYPLISTRICEHHTVPILEETLCFANIAKSDQRFVCALEWFPSISGLFVASYTFSTISTSILARTRQNIVQRDVLEPNPVLMWSFSDNLNTKLEFMAPREVTALSFCPFNTNLLIGGMSNGQIIIWDLQDRVAKLDTEEILTAAQQTYRLLIKEFLSWTIEIDDDYVITPAIITGLDVSHRSPVTGIYWMSSRHFISEFGKIQLKIKGGPSKFFITCSFDGSIFFWNLDTLKESKVSAASRRDLPKALLQSESSYKNKILKPTFKMQINEPIIGIVADTLTFSSIPLLIAKKRTNKLNYQLQIITDDPNEMQQHFIGVNMYGHIDKIEWFGLYGGEEMMEQLVAAKKFARVHDGPIVGLKRNPFLRDLFITIGRTIFAIWKDDFPYTPVLWRKCETDLSSVTWSESRPAVFFLTRVDGSLEAWDLIARDDSPCLVDTIGGGMITNISEHRQTEPEKLLGIGDYNSSFRMVNLPEAFYVLTPAEKRVFTSFIEKEVDRKTFIKDWETKYNDENKDIIEAKREAEAEARREMDRFEKEQLLQETRRAMEESEQLQSQHPHRNLSYPERVARQWEELNFKRMMNILMSRKRVDAEQLAQDSVLEKEHLSYEASKKRSVQALFKNVANELADIRARLLPVEKVDLLRNDMVMSAVRELLEVGETYEQIENELDNVVGKYDQFDDIDYLEILSRGQQRRKLLNKSLGSNTERLYWYEEMKQNMELATCDFGIHFFLKPERDSLTTQNIVEENEEDHDNETASDMI